ncbi:hypothetical protein ACF8Q9_07660 [Pseudomonas sp. TYF_15]|uniref:hypothetical protein n=1 Tax=Pseudomonas sp. TYF_15 TaxID=3367194 RepID=UPI00370C8E7A
MSSTIWMANMLTNNRFMLGGKRLTSFKSIKPLRKKIVGMASTIEINPVRMTLPSKPACWNVFFIASHELTICEKRLKVFSVSMRNIALHDHRQIHGRKDKQRN